VTLPRSHASTYERSRRLPEQRTLHAMAASLNAPLPQLLVPSTPSLALLRLLADLDQKVVADRFGFSQNRMPLIDKGLVALSNEMLRLANCLGTRPRAVRQALRSAARPGPD
jgi:hypothetical protein